MNVGTRASSHFVHEASSFWQRFSQEKLIILHDVLNKLTLPQSVPKILMRFLPSNAATNANNAQSKSGSLRERVSNVPIDLLCRCFETWAVNRYNFDRLKYSERSEYFVTVQNSLEKWQFRSDPISIWPHNAFRLIRYPVKNHPLWLIIRSTMADRANVDHKICFDTSAPLIRNCLFQLRMHV